MHNRKEMNYTDYMNDVLNDLKESIAKAKAVGIDDNRICTDPGVGFAKTYEQNLEIINKLEMLKTLVAIVPSTLSSDGKSRVRPITDFLEVPKSTG